MNKIVDLHLEESFAAQKMSAHDKLSSLRTLMSVHDIDAWIIPTSDPHSCEYPPDRWMGRAWISGFTGSAGTIIILNDQALLWTDGRYHEQAEKQLKGTGITVIKQGLHGVLDYPDWLAKSLPHQSTIGFDGQSMPCANFITLKEKLQIKEIKFKTELDLLNSIWNSRPGIPQKEIFEHHIKFAGKSRIEKIHEVRERMIADGVDYFILSSLDDIAWMLNIRGSDIKNCSVTICYALVCRNETYLCIENSKVPESLKASFCEDDVKLINYGEIFELAKTLPEKSTVFIDPSTTNSYLYGCIPKSCNLVMNRNYTADLKAIKNNTEIKSFGDCLVRDGIATLKFMKWFEENSNSGLTELDVSRKMNSLRSEDPLFHDISFTTIAAFGANAAQMHYLPSEQSHSKINGSGFLLLDSGGLYQDGTTDITRTFPVGQLSAEQIHDYTLVVKSHIALARTVFLEGCRGTQIDYAARADMWREGINYNCATGHGVGFFLNVHEGPINIGQRFIDAELRPGMIITNEPGIYKSDRHGVRIENMMRCYEKETTEFGTFFAFETVSYCPIETSCVNSQKLNNEEKEWLNSYHQQVYEKLSPHLGEELKIFLREKTQPI